MKNNRIKQFAYLLMATIGLSACNSYLDEQPSASSNAPITSASQLLSLYDTWTHAQETDMISAYITDDCGIPLEMQKIASNTFNAEIMCYYSGNSEVMESSNLNMLWQGEYSKIFDANTIISSGKSVTGTQEEINEALCNGYFMRAWSYFKLATIYCLPYTEANREKLGLPLRLDVTFTEDISRKTLGETFDQILSDLKNADELCVVDKAQNSLSWRVSKCAIYGLYARIYLYMGNYKDALTYADKAVALAPTLFDYNTLKWGTSRSYPATSTMPAQKVDYCETNSWNVTKIFKWQESVFTRLQYIRTQWLCPSQDLMDSYDKTNDLRFVYSYVEHDSRRFSIAYDYYRFDPFYDGRYNISGITTAELLLDKAELMVRTGDWQNALAVLTPLRQARFKTGTATALTATSQAEALKQVLAERRREIPFALRLMDIKRFAVSQTTDDDVTIKHDCYKVTQSGIDLTAPINVSIKGDSPKLAIPIPYLDIQDAQGVIIQNPFE